ncbi:thioredoxin family protein [Acholeplasma sp. OttesenSCG-928-E16]|nr:thioredoxin family protein [Acholeplasma sp. OttesenSCG-928-E16]
MKKILKTISISLILGIVFLMFGCQDNSDPETRSYSDYSHIESLDDIITNKKTKTLYMYTNECPYCLQIRSLVFDYADNHKSLSFIIRTQDIRDVLLEEFGIEIAYVPAILVFKDGVLNAETGFIWGTESIKAFLNK